ncbi:hypothetical protein BSKO_12074 [Bryopsis sp. KO-2023]|nr:hypothetical protein BSKO_12074 [Bryopsis sp. KO-2023]
MVKINPLAAEDSALTTPQSAKIPAVLAPPSSYGPAGQDLWTHLSCQEDRPQMNNFSAGSFSSNCSFEGNDVGNAVSKSTFDSKEEGVSMESFNSVIEFDVVDAANKSSHDSNRGEELFVSWLEGLEISRLSSNTGAQNEQKVLDKNAPQDNTETGRGGGEVQLEGTSGGEYSPRQSLELGVDTDEVAKNSAGPNSPILETGEIGREALSSKSEEDQCVRNNPVFCRGSSLPAVASLKEESQSLDVLETRVNWYEALAVERLQQTKTLKNQLDVLLTDYTTLKNELQSNQGCHEQYPVPDPLANCEYQQEADEVQRLRADLILAKTDLGLCRDLINEQAVQIRGLEEQIAKERQSRQKPELKAGKNCASGSIVADLLEHLDECSGALDILVKENTDMRSRVSLHQNKDLTPERQGNARIIKTLRKENEDLKLELSKVQGDLGKAKKAVDVLTRERNNLEKEASKRGRDLKVVCGCQSTNIIDNEKSAAWTLHSPVPVL